MLGLEPFRHLFRCLHYLPRPSLRKAPLAVASSNFPIFNYHPSYAQTSNAFYFVQKLSVQSGSPRQL